MEKGIAILGVLHDGAMGSVTGPELIQLAGHYPAGYTHIEEHINTHKYLDHQRIIRGRQVLDVTQLEDPETDCLGDSIIKTIDPPPATDGDDAPDHIKNTSRYRRLSEVQQQVILTMKAVGRKALQIHRTIRGGANNA